MKMINLFLKDVYFEYYVLTEFRERNWLSFVSKKREKFMRKMQKTNLHKLGRHLSNAKTEIVRVALKHAHALNSSSQEPNRARQPYGSS